MITQLRTYNTLRATVGPGVAFRLANMAPQRQGMPITLDGPHYGRKHQRRKALLRAARTACIVVAIVVGVPMVAGIAYGLALG